MKALNWLIWTLAIFGSITLHAQEPLYRWGDPLTHEGDDPSIEKFLGANNDGFYVLRSKGSIIEKYYTVDYVNPDLEVESSTPVNFSMGVMGNSADMEEIDWVNGTLYAFVGRWNKKQESHILELNRIENGELVESKKLDKISAQKMGNRGMYYRAWSPDGSKLLVLSEMPFEKKTNEKLKLTCFEAPSMNKLWSKSVTLNIGSKRAVNNEIAVDNAGNAYMFKKHRDKGWYYHLYTCDAATQNWKELRLDFEERTIVNHKMTFTPNQEFTLTGIYEIEKTVAIGEQINGYFHYRLDGITLTPEISWVQDWEAPILQTVYPNWNGDKEGWTIGGYALKDVLFQSNGNPVILLEKTRADRNMVAGSSPIQFSYEWEYGPILVFGLNPNTGEVTWTNLIDKHQETTSDEDIDHFGSFVYYMNDDHLYLIYNNTDLSIPSIPPASWTEPDGTKYVKKDAFDEKTGHASFLHVIDPSGQLQYANRTFGLPLFNMHKGSIFEMSMAPHFFFPFQGGIVYLAEMNGGQRYRYGLLSY